MPTTTVAQTERCTARLALAAGVEQRVEFADDVTTVSVMSMDGLAPVWVRVDGSSAAVDGKSCYVLPAAIVELEIEPPTSGPTTVSLVSSGTPTVIVGRA